MIIKNGLIFAENNNFIEGNILIKGNSIKNISEEPFDEKDEQVLNANGNYVIPGLVDIHLHGCVGHDFCEGSYEALESIAKYELSCGVTSICPASMTFDESTLTKVFNVAADYIRSSECVRNNVRKASKGARIIGINMEGPFISRVRAGAQNLEYVKKPDIEMFERLMKASDGLIKLVDVAPEVEGALDFIENVRKYVNVSVAHTDADYDTTMKAFLQGANHVTHLYNAMPEFLHRSPGVIGAAADCENVYVELIADGVHVDEAAVRATFKLFSENQIVLVSDSIEACGMPEGEYKLGGQRVYLSNNVARLENGTIAGSVSSLMDCFRTAVKNMRIPFEKVIKAATANPSKSIGIYDNYGSIEVGKIADFVILDKELNIVSVIKGGRKE